MPKKKFKLPPISPLIGGSLENFNRVIYGKRIDPPYRFKIFLTRLIILILGPLRVYNKFRIKRKKLPNKENLIPVFILGHWRSGTTYVHNLLSQDPGSAFVTTYQTVFPSYPFSRKLLKPIMNRVMPSHRPGDNVRLSADKPQEEEFALSNSTEHSFYNFFYFPKHTGEYYHKYVRFDLSIIEKQEFEVLYTRILQYAMMGKSNKSRLILKNPVNTGRLSFLTEKFPSAFYIHVYRNPYAVFLSTKKFFSELFPTLWLQKIDQNQLVDLIIDLYLNLYDDYFEFKERNPNFKVLEFPFEEFESDPLPLIKRFYEVYLEENFSELESYFISYIENHKSYSKNKYEISGREYELVSEKWSKYIKRWGYKLPPDIKIVG